MTDTKNHPQKNLNFSQRYGYEDLPEPMHVGQISDGLRRKIWNIVREKLLSFEEPLPVSAGYVDFGRRGHAFIERVLGEFYEKPVDEITAVSKDYLPDFKKIILQAECNRFLDFLEIIGNDEDGKILAEKIQNLFEEHAASYRLDNTGRRWQFFPCSSAEQGKVVQKAQQNLQVGGLQDVLAGLHVAADHIKTGNYDDSIAKCLNVVETAAKQIAPKKSSDLEDALQSILQSGILAGEASVLKKAIVALFGYASQLKDGRHGAGTNAPIAGQQEALFVYSICVVFADYLAAKHRQQK